MGICSAPTPSEKSSNKRAHNRTLAASTATLAQAQELAVGTGGIRDTLRWGLLREWDGRNMALSSWAA